MSSLNLLPRCLLRSTVNCAAVAFLLLASAPPHLAAQAGGDEPRPLPPTPGWVGEFTMLSANAALGGLTAGVSGMLNGRSFQDAFLRGMVGGSAIYGGKRFAIERFDGAGLIGRGMVAAGASVVRNAGAGRSMIEELVVPLGPVRLYINAVEGSSVHAKLDLNSIVMIGVASLDDELEFDLGRSLSAGAPVFTVREHLFGTPEDTVRASGKVVEGVIFLSELPWRSVREADEVFAHERVHVLQRDQLFITMLEPIGARVTEEIPRLAPLHRFVDVHPTDLVLELLKIPFADYEKRPWELEAFHLMSR